jgi:hypothetical protein
LVFHYLEVYELCLVLIHFYGSQEREKSRNLNHTKRAQCTLRGNMPVRCLEMQRWALIEVHKEVLATSSFIFPLWPEDAPVKFPCGTGDQNLCTNINFKANVFSYLISLCLNYVSLPWPCWMLHTLIIDKLLIKFSYPQTSWRIPWALFEPLAIHPESLMEVCSHYHWEQPLIIRILWYFVRSLCISWIVIWRHTI